MPVAQQYGTYPYAAPSQDMGSMMSQMMPMIMMMLVFSMIIPMFKGISGEASK